LIFFNINNTFYEIEYKILEEKDKGRKKQTIKGNKNNKIKRESKRKFSLKKNKEEELIT